MTDGGGLLGSLVTSSDWTAAGRSLGDGLASSAAVTKFGAVAGTLRTGLVVSGALVGGGLVVAAAIKRGGSGDMVSSLAMDAMPAWDLEKHKVAAGVGVGVALLLTAGIAWAATSGDEPPRPAGQLPSPTAPPSRANPELVVGLGEGSTTLHPLTVSVTDLQLALAGAVYPARSGRLKYAAMLGRSGPHHDGIDGELGVNTMTALQSYASDHALPPITFVRDATNPHLFKPSSWEAFCGTVHSLGVDTSPPGQCGTWPESP